MVLPKVHFFLNQLQADQIQQALDVIHCFIPDRVAVELRLQFNGEGQNLEQNNPHQHQPNH